MRRVVRLVPIVVALLLAVLLLPAGVVFAATTADVTVNATPSYVSISLNVSTFDFGTVAAGADEDTTTSYFGIDNTSTVTTSTTIVSNGWQAGGGSAWAWGAPAENQAQMKASDGDGTYDVTIDDSSPTAVNSAQAADTDWTMELQIDAATSYTHGDAQGTTVTLSCTAD